MANSDTEDQKVKSPFQILGQVGNTWLLLFFGGICAMLTGAAPLIFFLFLGNTFNSFTKKDANVVQLTEEVALNVLYLAIASSITALCADVLFKNAAFFLSNRIKKRYYKSCVKQEIGYFDSRKYGTLVNVLSEDCSKVTEALTVQIHIMCQNFVLWIGGFIVAMASQWAITLLVVSGVPIMLFLHPIVEKIVAVFSLRASTLGGASIATANEVINGIRTVRSMAGEEKESDKFTGYLKPIRNYGLIISLAKGCIYGVSAFLLFGGQAFSVWYGGIAIGNSAMDIGSFIKAFCLALVTVLGMSEFLKCLPDFIQNLVLAENILKVTLRVPKISAATVHSMSIEGEIEFENVSFTYPSRLNQLVLDNFNLQVHPGKSLAITGSSGSGKSTIIQLLEKFYEADSGRVLIDGVDIKTISPTLLHRHVGLVSQEPTLFAMSIRDNIRYAVDTINFNVRKEALDGIIPVGDVDSLLIPINEEIMIEAAKKANAHNFIMNLPDGYDTIIGERGVSLSGGQKQRIAIARAVLQDPKILLLDEATSALDSKSETIVQNALDKLMQGRTTIVIAHNLSTIHNCDRIIVMSQGKIVESGNHVDLCVMNGTYAKMATRKQSFRSSKRITLNNESLDLSSGTEPTIEEEHRTLVERETSSFLLFRFFKMIGFEWIVLTPGIVGSIVGGAAFTMTFLIVGNAIVEIVPTRNADGSYVPQVPGFSIADSMAKWGLYMTYLAIAGGVFKGAEILFGALSAERFGYQLRNYLFKSIVSQEIGFFDSTSSGKLLGLIAEETSTVQQIYTTRLLAFVQNASSFVVGMILALVASWKTSLLMLAGGVPTIGLSVIITAIVVYYSSKTMNKLSASSLALANEAMGSIRTVRSMAAEDREVARFGQNLDSHARIAVIKSMILGVCAAVQQFAFWGCNAFIFYYAGQLIDKGELPQGELLHLFGYMYVAMIGLTTAATDLSHFYKANVAAHSILKVALRQPKIQNKGKTLIDPKPSSIEFKRIKFAYPTRPNTFILTNFSLKIEPGEHVGVVGESGAGKSTLTALVERFYEATEGSVLIDGVNVQDIDNKCLHKHIAIVTQEPTLFNATIRENIKYAVGNDAADEQMISCAKAANCHNFIIQLPDGYDTIVGDRGVSMSGGQKQRIAIARAMMQNASILLLDEATSALDTESEQLVQEALNELMANKTTLIIAHRLTAVQDCDRICVMANGDIVEEGTHEELIAKQGIYTSLAKKQIENT